MCGSVGRARGLPQSCQRAPGAPKMGKNRLKYVFCGCLSFVSVDCCRCGRGALSGRLLLLCAGARWKNKWVCLYLLPIVEVLSWGWQEQGAEGEGGVKHRGEFCHLQSAPGPCCGAGDEGRELEWGSGGCRGTSAAPSGRAWGQRDSVTHTGANTQ